MWCFKGEELDLLQRHEITTAEKSFMCHSNFTQGSHVVEVDDAFSCMAQNLLTNRLGRYHLSINKEYKERFQDNMPQTHAT